MTKAAAQKGLSAAEAAAAAARRTAANAAAQLQRSGAAAREAAFHAAHVGAQKVRSEHFLRSSFRHLKHALGPSRRELGEGRLLRDKQVPLQAKDEVVSVEQGLQRRILTATSEVRTQSDPELRHTVCTCVKFPTAHVLQRFMKGRPTVALSDKGRVCTPNLALYNIC